MYAALIANDASASRLRRFAHCAASWYMLESRSRPGVFKLSPDFCHDRWCVPCSKLRAETISGNLLTALAGRPTRMLTLTVRSVDVPLREQVKHLLASFRRLRRLPLWNRHVRGGVAILEVTKNEQTGLWHPHLHCLTEGSYIPLPAFRDEWERCTGDSRVLHVQYVGTPGRACHYVSKYLTKPCINALYHDPVALAHAVDALRGQKQLVTFGTWRRFKLTALLKEDDWKSLGHWHELVYQQNDAGRRLCQLIQAMQENPKHAMEREFTASDYGLEIDRGPPVVDLGRPGCQIVIEMDEVASDTRTTPCPPSSPPTSAHPAASACAATPATDREANTPTPTTTT